MIVTVQKLATLTTRTSQTYFADIAYEFRINRDESIDIEQCTVHSMQHTLLIEKYDNLSYLFYFLPRKYHDNLPFFILLYINKRII